MSTQIANLDEFVDAGNDFLSIVISRDEVDNKDYSNAMPILRGLVNSSRVAAHFREKVDISFSGYENHRDELWEIVEVRNYVNELDKQFPYWLFFLSKHTAALNCITLSFLPPFLTPEGRKQEHAPRLQHLLEKRWVPAMNQLCDLTGISEKENEEMTNRFLEYISK